ncbi:hypothetical protein BKA70DRAFT_1489969 [Coprinopsis sp. MPI-PUGE-AT-0042]|nr:hypothetical protein BKA70DRAFT_1489969 [Coprinopsis sp. MPI-PUGE-AT-0042]
MQPMLCTPIPPGLRFHRVRPDTHPLFYHRDILGLIALDLYSDGGLTDIPSLRLVNQTLGEAGQRFTFRHIHVNAQEGTIPYHPLTVRAERFIDFSQRHPAIPYFARSLDIALPKSRGGSEQGGLNKDPFAEMIRLLAKNEDLVTLSIKRVANDFAGDSVGIDVTLTALALNIKHLRLQNIDYLSPSFLPSFHRLESLSLERVEGDVAVATKSRRVEVKCLHYSTTALRLDTVNYEKDRLLAGIDMASVESLTCGTRWPREMFVSLAIPRMVGLQRLVLDLTGVEGTLEPLPDMAFQLPADTGLHAPLRKVPVFNLPHLTDVSLTSNLPHPWQLVDIMGNNLRGIGDVLGAIHGSECMKVEVRCLLVAYNDLSTLSWDGWHHLDNSFCKLATNHRGGNIAIAMSLVSIPGATPFTKGFLRARLEKAALVPIDFGVHVQGSSSQEI